MQKTDLSKYCLDLYENLRTKSNSFSIIWDEVDRYFRPSRKSQTADQFIPEQANRPDGQIFAAEAAYCWDVLSSGLYSYMIPEKSYFFQVKYDEHGGRNNKELENENTRILHYEIEKTNFREEIYKAIRDVALYGTNSMIMEQLKEDGRFFTFKAFPIRNIYGLRDYKSNDLTTVIRAFPLTPDQAANEFGVEKLSEKVSNKVGNVRYAQDTNTYIHLVCKSDYLIKYADTSGVKLTKQRYASIYIDVDNKAIVGADGGFDNMPYIIAPFIQQDYEMYGRSYATEYLPEVKMLNSMMRTLIFGSEMASNPPLIDPSGGYEQFNIKPGIILPVNPGGERPEFLEIRANPALNLDLVSYQRNLLREMFRVTLFKRLTDKKYLTAYQASEIAGEGLDLLAPIVNNLQQMMVRPIIQRAHKILRERGIIEVPEGSEMSIEYLGKLAFAVKSLENQSAVDLLQAAALTAQFAPESIDVINGDQLLSDYIYNTGAPPRWVRKPKEVQRKREERAQAEANARASEDAKNLGNTVANLGKNIEPNSVMGGFM